MFSNNSTQTQFYNKQLELQKDGLDVLENENNLLRGEIRLLKREPVKSQIGIVSLYDLINTDQSFIDDKYKTYLNKRMQVYRIKAEVSKIMQRKGRNDKKRGEVSTGLLLNEIQEKFAA